MNIDEQYKNMLIEIYQKGIETAPRGMPVRELFNYVIELDPKDNIITLPGLETNLSYAKEELEWYYAATNRIDWSPRIKRIWSKFSDDGETVNSSYGHRIFGAHKDFPNQWEWVKKLLQKDSDSRRAVLNINYPRDKDMETKDLPCTMFIQLFIRNGKLNWLTSMRSNDAYFGFRNDVYCFAEMQKRMAKELGVEVGTYMHHAGSMHIYEAQFDKVKKLIEEK